MIKLFIEDVKNELNVVVWNNVTDDMKLDQILPNPIACLNVPVRTSFCIFKTTLPDITLVLCFCNYFSTL